MVKLFPRLALTFSALVLAVGVWMHTSVFHKISSAVDGSDLMPLAAKSLKMLWLEDSVVLLVLAVLFGVIAAWPSAATRWVIVLLALIPAATAALVYSFIGSFIGGHMLLASAIAAILGGLQYPGTRR